jgi:carbon-monoxide dehydrogenase medium subunit
VHPFTYHRAGSVAAAAELLRARPGAKLLAGGMSLLPLMKLRLAAPTDLVDLCDVADLTGIAVTGESVAIRGMTSHAAVAASAEVARAIPALAALAGGIGDPHCRNRGTIGGSLGHSDPAACYPAAALALAATIVTDRREIPADGFFRDGFETALAADEIITAVRFPIPDTAAYIKFPQPASRFALVGVFVARRGGRVRVAVTGAGTRPFRVPPFEDALAAGYAPQALDGIAIAPDGLNDDIHADPEYRAHLIGVLARRAVAGSAA